MNIRKKSLIILLMMVFFIFMGAASAASTDKNVNLNDKRFSTVNLPFVENHGQIADKTVKYSVNTFIGNVYVKDKGIVYSLTKDKKGWIVTESFLKANDVTVKGVNPTKTKVNYYKGTSVQKNLATYTKVQYTNLYHGVNLNLKAHGKNIEKIYTIGSLGSPTSIWVKVTGSKGMKINKKGELEILNGKSALKLTKPVAYQIINGEKIFVPVSYIVKNTSYGYKTGTYNKKYNLIIDPLLSSTYLGGNSYDNAQGVAVDQAGNVYITGYTGSDPFPTTSGSYQPNINGQEWDVFVSKFDSTLTNLLSSTYIGGNDSDQAYGITLDQNGLPGCNVFITGITYSNEATSLGFPITGGSFDTSYNGGGDAFISKFSNDLSNLEASTYLGGLQDNGLDRANAIIVDASNNVYVTGQTFSSSFPIVSTAYQETNSGSGDVFVSKFNNALSNLTASTFIGGIGEDIGYALATDQQNYIYVTGATNSEDFPVKNYQGVVLINNTPFNNGYKGEYDAFIVKLAKQHLEKLEASSLIGGTERDEGRGVAVDPVGRVYIVGGTWSTNMQITIGAKQTSKHPMEDAFVIIFDKQIQTVLSSTYLGGNGIDIANGIIISDQGNIGIIGTTNSTKTNNKNIDFPYDPDTNSDITAHGYEDVFFTAFLNPMTGQERVETTLLGGSNADYGQAIAINRQINNINNFGMVYLTGKTWSNDFPTTIGANATSSNDFLQYTDDVFLSKIDNLFDTQPPILGPTDPFNIAENVPVNKIIKLVFNEQIQIGNQASWDLISLKHGGIDDYNLIKTIVGNTLIITPSNLLQATEYTLNIPVTAIKDLSGNYGDKYTLSFQTFTPLSVVKTEPLNNAPNIVGNTPIKITFNKSIKTGSNYNLITLKNSALITIPITKTINGSVLTIIPTVNLTPGTYTLNLPLNSILDLNNSAFIPNNIIMPGNNLIFTVTAPIVISTNPVNNGINVPTNQLLAVAFTSPPIKLGSGSIQLKSSTGVIIPISFSITDYSTYSILYIYHTTQQLATNTIYTLTLNPNCITDLAGNGLTTQYITQFKTATTAASALSKTPANIAPKVISSNPVKNAVNIPTNKVIKINFSEAIKFGKSSWIELKNSSGKAISFTKSITGSTLIIKPTTKLKKGTTYTVIIHTNSITDLLGKGLAIPYTTKFKTGTV